MDLSIHQPIFRVHNPLAKRTYNACLRCRQRKAKCDLDSNATPGITQCSRCRRESRECVPGETGRGRPRKSKTPQARRNRDIGHDRMSQSPDDGADNFERIQNPSDALGILAQVADNNPRSEQQGNTSFQPHFAPVASQTDHQSPFQGLGGSAFLSFHQEDSIPYQLCNDGLLTTSKVRDLVSRYASLYHLYFPIVPARIFDPARLSDVALKEQHLLTAILTIASKDLIEEADTYTACSNHMQKLISALVIGMKAEVDAVEALLLLAEWTPHQQNAFSGSVGRGEEDRAAWMYVGMALRVGYFLGLDSTSFRTKHEPRDEEFLRRRLVWAACYMSDRQISVRIGRAFWSRGPGPLTGFTRGDFPTLQPKSSKDENYASIFQATLELTQLFSNVHEILYTQRGPRLEDLLVKDYIKYIDDFRAAIKGWNSVWGTLTCSPNLKATLLISYDYLRLYTNAFAFQANASQSRTSKKKPKGQRPSFISIASAPDARFIYEALDAAKSLLVTANNFVDPENCLRYMPLRFYLYIIYSAVFLYKARFLSAASEEEKRAMRDLINETINRLKRASVGPQDLGSRYARLLNRLWRKGDPDSSISPDHGLSNDSANHNMNANTPFNSGHSALQQFTANVDFPTDNDIHGVTGGNANSARQYPAYDFNWLDLDAVGEFALDDTLFSAEQMLDIDMMWHGFGFGIESGPSEMSMSSPSL